MTHPYSARNLHARLICSALSSRGTGFPTSERTKESCRIRILEKEHLHSIPRLISYHEDVRVVSWWCHGGVMVVSLTHNDNEVS